MKQLFTFFVAAKTIKNLVATIALLTVLTTAWASDTANSLFSPVFTKQEQFTNSKDTIGIELQNDYLYQITAEVLLVKEGETGEIINKFSGNSTDWNWVLKQGTLPENINASTTFVNGGAVTTLNVVTLTKASNLSVARTVLHELIHAYLTIYFRTDQRNAISDYPQILAAWVAVNNPDYNEIQHKEMQQSFLEVIAASLKEYAQRMDLKINDDFIYADLAWGGLDFVNDTELSEEDKERIQQRLNAGQFFLKSL